MVVTRPKSRRLAAIDVGSTSTHLVIAEVDDFGHIHILETLKEQTLLGAALSKEGYLDVDTVVRMSSTLGRMADLAKSYDAELWAVGTHSLRQARNGRQFCAKVARRCGVHVEIITGQEEARLIYLGIQLGLEMRNQDLLLMDIGGGSTEILIGERGEEQFSTSLKLGCVRLTHQIFASATYTPSEIRKLEKHVSVKLKSIAKDVSRVGYGICVCSSGTVKAVKQLALALNRKTIPENLHGDFLSREEIEVAYTALKRALSPKDRKNLPGVDASRAEILLAGCAILREFSLQHGITRWTLSMYALREGMLVDLVRRSGSWLKGDPEDVRWRSVRSFAKRLSIDEAHAHRVTALALKIFDIVAQAVSIPESWREYLRCAAHLHESGRFLSFSGYHKHTHYLIRNASLAGFTLAEQEVIALIARFHRKRQPKASDELFSNLDEDDKKWLSLCAAMLRLAVSLDKSRAGLVSELRGVFAPEVFKLHAEMRRQEDAGVELFDFEAQKNILSQAFQRPVELTIGQP